MCTDVILIHVRIVRAMEQDANESRTAASVKQKKLRACLHRDNEDN